MALLLTQQGSFVLSSSYFSFSFLKDGLVPARLSKSYCAGCYRNDNKSISIWTNYGTEPWTFEYKALPPPDAQGGWKNGNGCWNCYLNFEQDVPYVLCPGCDVQLCVPCFDNDSTTYVTREVEEDSDEDEEMIQYQDQDQQDVLEGMVFVIYLLDFFYFI